MSRLPALCDELGITYRQGDHWCRRGYLLDDADEATPGQGFQRDLRPVEEARLREMARLVHAGMTPRVAARNARRRVTVGPSARALELAWAAGRGEAL